MSSKGGEPGKGLLVSGSKPSGKADTDADLRDSVAMLVGGGYTNLGDDQSRAHFNQMASTLGTKKAQDLLLHIFLQNQRPGFAQMKPAERLQRFYDIPSSNAPTQETLDKLKAFGSGPQAGYSDSINLTNQTQQGNGLLLNSITKK